MLDLGFGIKGCTQFLRGLCVWYDFCLWLDEKLQSLFPKDHQEQVTHPYVVQHPEK